MQLAMLLELSAYPKPGNVHRTRDYSDMRFEHFLGAVSGLHSSFYKAAQLGCIRKYGGRVGRLIFDAVANMFGWQTDGNTSLGTIMLLIPLSMASGKVIAEDGFKEFQSRLKREINEVCEEASHVDSIWVYKAIQLAKPGGLGSVEELDINEDSAMNKIKEDNVRLRDIFMTSASYDSIASEWAHGFDLTFNVGHPFFNRTLEECGDINAATVNTFLKILSERPDSLIARKAGLKEAEKVSRSARIILEKGGILTEEGRERLWKLDERLGKRNHTLNPGTTADLTCSSISIATAAGFRP